MRAKHPYGVVSHKCVTNYAGNMAMVRFVASGLARLFSGGGRHHEDGRKRVKKGRKKKPFQR